MKNRIRILATSDVHARITGESYTNGRVIDGGLARLNTLITTLRDEDTILVDNGDALNGSVLSFHQTLTHPKDPSFVSTVMNGMKYDLLNIGFHDFDNGADSLKFQLKQFNAPCITSNVTIHDEPVGVTYAIQEAAGKKTAFIGILSDGIVRRRTKEQLKHCHFDNALDSLNKAIKLVKRLEKPDYIVCLYQGGFEQDPENGVKLEENTKENAAYQLMAALPEIDVMIAGHTGRSMCGITRQGTVYAEPHMNGTELICIDLYTDTHKADVQMYQADADEDTRVLAAAKAEETECQQWLDTELGMANLDLSITDLPSAALHKPQLITLLNMAMMDMTHAQLSACSLSADSEGLAKKITTRNVVTSCSDPSDIIVKEISGKTLRYFLEQNAEFFTVMGDHPVISPRCKNPDVEYDRYCFVDGISYTINALNDCGSRIVDLLYQGQPVTDDMEFTLAISAVQALNYPTLAKAPTVSTITVSLAEIAADYIKAHTPIEFEPQFNIKVIAE
ncbi:MAG: 5'-nucleotidase C-terminal domain-containing protein [Solobacterium sp.]|jgi:2',3'-cyclic-nucleotide 2'-phosphodiesterase/3'-nucleotidase|nr:5'-nucleotidase C-terminal domain-containing protein [Solobacterium sp.]MCH4221858.1 5'-nucleotidase C-terminal domain-containing protein [Solobacterium sp.]MCH4265181.1 5'-nucleotidase C-terminal domain-containing protein [Solobacterium sp.]